MIERYMGERSRPAFANLLRNLGPGVLRIGGSSQDVMPFDSAAPNTLRIITPEDLAAIRSVLESINGRHARAPAWGAVLGTAMAPPSASRPFVSPEHARNFARGVRSSFPGPAARQVAGIELGNEPDLSYGTQRLPGYLNDLSVYSAPEVTGPLPIVAPNTSEDILPWPEIAAGPTRYFWNWPQILDTVAPHMRARAGAFGAYASDHFYPLARTCVNRPYRCPSIPALLSAEHMASLDYQVYHHAQDAAARGVAYRLEETNTAAGRGADGVSNVAASATYALDMMFHAACPQPPDTPGANARCDTGAIGVNLHNAEVRAFFAPEEGNAYYNAIDYDPSPALGAPRAAPVYYALLLFGRLAQGMQGLRPVAVAPPLSAWRLEGPGPERRLFVINKGGEPVDVDLDVRAPLAWITRMTPNDPTGAGRTLDAGEVRIDGRQVEADGRWRGFHPTIERVRHHRIRLTVTPGEATVISARAQEAGR